MRSTVLFYNPQSTTPGKQPLPLSLLSVAAVIDADYECEFIDGNIVPDAADRIIDRARATNAKLLAVTVMPGPQLRAAVATCKAVKAALPGLLILWGGYFPTQHAEVTLRSQYVDFCIEGQGEAPFRKLVDTVHQGGSFADVPSLWYRDNGTVKQNLRGPMIPIDPLPWFPYHRLDMAAYRRKNYLGDVVYNHNTSFGCPYACNFCAVVALSKRRWIAESAKRAADVVAHLHNQYGATGIELHDMDFFVNEERAAEFAERITPLGVNWWGLGRVDTLSTYSEDTWKKLQASGVRMIFMGAESGSDEVLARMNKGGKSATNLTLEIAAKLKRLGIVPEFSFVLGNPPDPMSDINDSIKFIRKLKAINPASELILYLYTPVPQENSELYDAARKAGFKFPETLEEWANDNWEDFALRRSTSLPWIKPTPHRRVRNFESVINAYYPTTTDMRLQRNRSMQTLLRGLSGWRYRLGFYDYPVELKALQRLIHYRRPETTGF